MHRDKTLQAHRWFVATLAANGGLRDELDSQRATDIVFGLHSHELYPLLVIERGWAPRTGSGRRTRWPCNSCPQG